MWARVATNQVLLYDVLYGEYFKEPSELADRYFLFQEFVKYLNPQAATQSESTHSWRTPGTQTPRSLHFPTDLSTHPYMGAQSLGRQEYPNCDELTDRQQTVYFIIIDYVSYLCDDSVGGGELGAEKKQKFQLEKI